MKNPILRALSCVFVLLCTVAVSGAILSFAATAPSEDSAPARRGISAYMGARYAEALPDLEKARDAGASNGPLLYMLAFCYEAVQHDTEASSRIYAAAQETLVKETASKDAPLESFFYLSNLYQNRQAVDESRKIAELAAGAIEKKRIKVGKDGISLFRAGKLFADAGKADQAIAFHRRAMAAFNKDASPPPEYVKRALETVARADLGKGDAEQVASLWERLLSLNPKVADGDWNLALAALRAHRFGVAKDAFQRARSSGGDRSEDAFYASQFCLGAGALVASGFKLPTRDADGKDLSSLAADAISLRLKEYAKNISTVLARTPSSGDYVVILNKRGKKVARPSEKLAKEIGDLNRYFDALVIELVLRGAPLQAKSFQDGYASLVIHAWPQLWDNAHRDLQEQVADAPAPAN